MELGLLKDSNEQMISSEQVSTAEGSITCQGGGERKEHSGRVTPKPCWAMFYKAAM